MFMVVHAAVGAAAGQAVAHKSTAFVLGIISHFFLDMVPHGDEGIYQGYVSGSRVKRAFLYVGADALLTVVFVAVIFLHPGLVNPANVAWGVVGGLLPDALAGLSQMLRPKKSKGLIWRLDRYNAFHRWNHAFLLNHWKRFEKDIPWVAGLVYQSVLFFFLIKIIL